MCEYIVLLKDLCTGKSISKVLRTRYNMKGSFYYCLSPQQMSPTRTVDSKELRHMNDESDGKEMQRTISENMIVSEVHLLEN